MHMYRKYGQIFAPAISALPPSVVVVVVLGQHRSGYQGADVEEQKNCHAGDGG